MSMERLGGGVMEGEGNLVRLAGLSGSVSELDMHASVFRMMR